MEAGRAHPRSPQQPGSGQGLAAPSREGPDTEHFRLCGPYTASVTCSALLLFVFTSPGKFPKHSKLADCAKAATVCLLVVEEKTPALSWLGSSPDPPSPSAVSFVWLLYRLCAWGAMGGGAGTWVGVRRGGVHKSPSPEGVVGSHDFRQMKHVGDGGCGGHSVAPALASRFGREDGRVWWSFRVCHFPVGAGHRKMSTKRDVLATFCAAGRINTVCFEY